MGQSQAVGPPHQAGCGCALACCPRPARAVDSKGVAALVAAYALSPIDLIPDVIPVLGYVDDLILVPLGILLAVRLVPVRIDGGIPRQGDRPEPSFQRAGFIAILLIWLGLGVAASVWIWNRIQPNA